MTPVAHSVALLLGGNVGDTKGLIACAIERLGETVAYITSLSHLYETEPWGMTAEQPFINQAVLLLTECHPETLLAHTQAIEAELGRQPHAPTYDAAGYRTYSSRPIDIDIIFFDHLAVSTPQLELPHPRMHLRRFVLEPLAEVAPDWQHPVLGKTVAELLAECTDTGRVVQIANRDTEA